MCFTFASHASEPPLEYIPFESPTKASRGSLDPVSQESYLVTRPKYCQIVTEEWGWDNCDGLELFIVNYTDAINILISEAPNSEGLVKFDEWQSDDHNDQIKEIEEQLKESISAQAKALNANISFEGWKVYPTLNIHNNSMFYAYNLKWEGEFVTNIKLSLFDRQGYVVFRITPNESNLNEAQLSALIENVIQNYHPVEGEKYADFKDGDKVAAVGAMGVLAGLLGVKYGKIAGAGLLALLFKKGGILILLKKGGFLLLLPLFWVLGQLKNVIFRPKKTMANDGETPPSQD
ncbi:DUF2167 domain-containing protein [Polycladidibacter stylochi]|uniref:DUF2167 domain-containing protein n=1 Tax=Polycladidibacter stylochi TaxID=1807766 RepID=UPI00082EA732|nr:DUF2167 domain-containing protein [Pseudovibrio stylochi]